MSLLHTSLIPLRRRATVQSVKGLKLLKETKHQAQMGSPNDYYKEYAPMLIPHLVEVFISIQKTGSIPTEMLLASISTLPKPGKDPDRHQNFRPISLLNTDLKLYAKIIADRVALLLPGLIHQNQVGFVRGRVPSDGTSRFIDLIDYVKRTRTPSLPLSLDAEKAFDRVHWGYLEEILKKFGFSEAARRGIMALYTHRPLY